jgi:hypothetical protein
VQRSFGDFDYRKFRLYLWGSAYEFLSRSLDCYRLILSTLDARTLSLAHLTPARFAGEASPPQRGERSCVNSVGQRVGPFHGEVS